MFHAANSNSVNPDTFKPRAPQHIIRALKEQLRYAHMDRAAFGFDSEKVKTYGNCAHEWEGEDDPNITEFIKERTRIWRETWIIPELEAMIAWAEGR